MTSTTTAVANYDKAYNEWCFACDKSEAAYAAYLKARAVLHRARVWRNEN